MDGISSAVTIISVIETCQKAIRFLLDVSDADESRRQIINQIRGSSEILYKLHDIVKDNPGRLPDLQALLAKDGWADQFKDTVENLIPKLTSAKGLRDVPKRIKFVASKSIIKEELQTLDSYQNRFRSYQGFAELNLLLAYEDRLRILPTAAEVQQMVDNLSIGGSDKAVLAIYRQQTPMIPFERNLDTFVPREDILNAVSNALSQGSRAALWGLSGAGKSRIAIEFIYRLIDKEPEKAKFWVSALDRSHFTESLRLVAEEIPLHYRKAHSQRNDQSGNDTEKLLTLVKDWLLSPISGSWIMVLDNVDSGAIFDVKHGYNHPLFWYIPQTSKGQVLVTTRFQRFAQRFVNDSKLVKVPLLNPGAAVDLFRRYLDDKENAYDDVLDLVNALDCLPLAIRQTAAYIKNCGPFMTLRDYLELMKSTVTEELELLEQEFDDDSRVIGVPNALLRSWQMNFEQIKKQSTSAADMVCIFGVLDREAVPIFLLRDVSASRIRLINDLGLLHQWSFFVDDVATVQPIEDSVRSMHRLVHLSTKFWLSREGGEAEWQTKVSRMIHDAFDRSLKNQAWRRCRLLVPHALVAIKFSHVEPALTEGIRENINALKERRKQLQRQWYLQPGDVLKSFQRSVLRQNKGWFFDLPEFQAWIAGDEALLWFMGGHGTGKSILCSLVISHLVQQQEQERKFRVLHYFFRFLDRKNILLGCFETLLNQLTEGDDMPSEMDRLLDAEEGKPETASIATYVEVLMSIFKRSEYPIFIIIDAIEEIGDQESFSTFFEFLEMVQEECPPSQVRILATSQANIDMWSLAPRRHKKLSAAVVSMDQHAQSTQLDISAMIEQELSDRFDGDLRRLVRDFVLNRSQGEFLHARIFLDLVNKTQSEHEVSKILTGSSEDFYKIFLNIIAKLGTPQPSHSRKLFLWTLYSERPFRVGELTEVMRWSENKNANTAPDADTSEVYNKVEQLSGGLIRITTVLDHLVVRPVHQTVRHLLMDENLSKDRHISPVEGHETILRRCLEHLMDAVIISTSSSHSATNPPAQFSKYAATQWPFHWQALRAQVNYIVPEEIHTLLHRLFDPRNPSCFSSWLELRRSDDYGAGFEEPPEECSSMATYIDTLHIPVSLDSTYTTLCQKV